MIEVKNLTKQYGKLTAVDHISFSVGDGEVLGFLGPNGAGKSTVMNIMTGNLSATEGTARICGYEILESPMEAKRKIGYLPELPPLYPEMTVESYLKFVYRLRGVRLPEKEHIRDVCEMTGVASVSQRIIRNLSKGYRQRIGIAQALIGNPEVLILDEPTVGLDPKQIQEIMALVKQLGKEHTVIFSSHILPEVQQICSRIIILNHGKIAADDTLPNLSRRLSGEGLRVRIEGPQEGIRKALTAIPGVKSVSMLSAEEKGCCDYRVVAVGGSDVRRAVFRTASEKNWPILYMSGYELPLEDIFLQITGGER